MVRITKDNYAWTKEDEDMLIEYHRYCVSIDRNHKSGSFCTFIPYTINIGAKLYEYSDDRNGALKNQMIAHHHNVGPKCGTPFEIVLDDRFYFGYLTEIAESMPICTWNNISYEIEQKYRSLGFLFKDWWVTNVGILNGNPIVIDFDPVYFDCTKNTIEIP